MIYGEDKKLTNIPDFLAKDTDKDFNVHIVVNEGSGVYTKVEIPINTIEDIYKQFVKGFYYKDDIITRIEEMIEEGDLPEDALKNERYIEKLVDIYEEKRTDNEGLADDEIQGWDIILDDAFLEVDYEDFIKEEGGHKKDYSRDSKSRGEER